jgi:hypothetical protein
MWGKERKKMKAEEIRRKGHVKNRGKGKEWKGRQRRKEERK